MFFHGIPTKIEIIMIIDMQNIKHVKTFTYEHILNRPMRHILSKLFFNVKDEHSIRFSMSAIK